MILQILLVLSLIFSLKIQNSNACNTKTGLSAAPNYGTCGETNSKSLESKIINGNNAVPNSWPWLASIRWKGSHICGGSIIHERYILSAAHCFDNVKNYSEITVIVGLHNVNTYSASQVYQNENITMHPSFSSVLFTTGDDIALIKLKTPVQMSATVSLICLPWKDDASKIVGQNVKVAGWGRTDAGMSPVNPDQLQETTLYVGDGDKKCTDFIWSFYNNMFVPSRLYCLFDKASNRSNICQGDSGGAVFYNLNSKWTVFGIVSFIKAKKDGSAVQCVPTDPSFVTKVPTYIDWVDETIKKG